MNIRIAYQVNCLQVLYNNTSGIQVYLICNSNIHRSLQDPLCISLHRYRYLSHILINS